MTVAFFMIIFQWKAWGILSGLSTYVLMNHYQLIATIVKIDI